MHLDADLNFDRPLSGEEREFLKPHGAAMGRSLWLKHVDSRDLVPVLDYLAGCGLSYWSLRLYFDPPEARGLEPPCWVVIARHGFEHANPPEDFSPPPCELCRRPGRLPVDRVVRLTGTSGGRIVSWGGMLLVSGTINLPDSTRVEVDDTGIHPRESWFRLIFDRRVEYLDHEASTLGEQRCGVCGSGTREFTGLPVLGDHQGELPRMFAETRRYGRGSCEEMILVEHRHARIFRRYPGNIELLPVLSKEHDLVRAALAFRAALDDRLSFITDFGKAPFNRQKGATAPGASPIFRAITTRRVVEEKLGLSRTSEDEMPARNADAAGDKKAKDAVGDKKAKGAVSNTASAGAEDHCDGPVVKSVVARKTGSGNPRDSGAVK